MWERVGGDEWKDGKAMKTERRSSPHEIHEGQGVRPVKGPWLANIQIWAPLAARLSPTLAPCIGYIIWFVRSMNMQSFLAKRESIWWRQIFI